MAMAVFGSKAAAAWTPRRSLSAASSILHFNGTLDISRLASSPLEELRRRSEARGICDGAGRRLKGAPWGMQLAHAEKAHPWSVVRTVGFKRVTADGLTFLLRRRGAPRPAEASASIAIVYVEGRYRPGEVCEQWRCEGDAVEVGVGDVAETAPPASFAQMIVAAGASSVGEFSPEMRLEMTDPSGFVTAVSCVKARLQSGQARPEELGRSVVVYVLRPVRAEILIGGPDFGAWERAEWRWTVDGDSGSLWAHPRRILPF